jgi:hypothetical protein
MNGVPLGTSTVDPDDVLVNVHIAELAGEVSVPGMPARAPGHVIEELVLFASPIFSGTTAIAPDAGIDTVSTVNGLTPVAAAMCDICHEPLAVALLAWLIPYVENAVTRRLNIPDIVEEPIPRDFV